MPPNAAAIIEFQIASTARRFAPNAEPPLNPSQPSQRMNVPRPTSETLCGRKLSSSRSVRRPSTHEYARPPMPLPISTGPPPKRATGLGEQTGLGEDGVSRTGVVEHTPLECPPVRGPCPARERTIHQGHPEEAEDERRHDAPALRERTHEDRDGHAGELHLVEAVEQLGDERRAGAGVGEDAAHAKVVEVADEAIGGGGGEGEGVAPEVPLEDDDRVARGDDPDEVQRALAAGEPGVEERCGRARSSACDDPPR